VAFYLLRERERERERAAEKIKSKSLCDLWLFAVYMMQGMMKNKPWEASSLNSMISLVLSSC